MGLGGISPMSLLLILLIALVLFGGKRLRGLGEDLGNAIKGFRAAVKDEDVDAAHEGQDGKPPGKSGSGPTGGR